MVHLGFGATSVSAEGRISHVPILPFPAIQAGITLVFGCRSVCCHLLALFPAKGGDGISYLVWFSFYGSALHSLFLGMWSMCYIKLNTWLY